MAVGLPVSRRVVQRILVGVLVFFIAGFIWQQFNAVLVYDGAVSPTSPKLHSSAAEINSANEKIQAGCLTKSDDSRAFMEKFECNTPLDEFLPGHLQVHVDASANGVSERTGSVSNPFINLKEAREYLRFLRSGHDVPEATKLSQHGAVILLRKGTYVLNETFQLVQADSGTLTAPVVYRGAPGEVVEITGAIDVPTSACHPVAELLSSHPSGKVADLLNRVPTAAQQSTFHCDLNAVGGWIASDFTIGRSGFSWPVLPTSAEVAVNGKIFQHARWPNSQAGKRIFATVTTVLDQGSVTRNGETADIGARFKVSAEDDSFLSWTSNNIWAFGYFHWDWADESVPVASINKDTGEIQLAGATHYGVKVGARISLFNAAEALDEPGDYYIDELTASLLLFPHSTDPVRHIQLSILKTPLVAMRSVSHVTLACMHITATRGTAFQVLGGNHVSLMHLEISNIGNVGVMFGEGAIRTPGDAVVGLFGAATTDYWFNHFEWDRHVGQNHLVYRSRIHDIGGGAIIVGGGNRTSLQPGCNQIVENVIERFSRLTTTYRPAVWIDGVGQTSSRNTIRQGPHSAIIVYGNGHLIEQNDIGHVCLETTDAGVIYSGRDWASQGTIIRFNYIHSSGYTDAYGVYLDDLASGTLIYSNLFKQIPGGVKIGGGRTVAVISNFFVRCKTAAKLDDRGIKRWDTLSPVLLQRLSTVPHDSGVWASTFPSLSRILVLRPKLPVGNTIEGNILCATEEIKISGDAGALLDSNHNRRIDGKYCANTINIDKFIAPANTHWSLPKNIGSQIDHTPRIFFLS